MTDDVGLDVRLPYRIKSEPTFWLRLYLAGDLDQIKQACREYCMEVGLCVTVRPIDFIYTGGEESGAEVRI